MPRIFDNIDQQLLPALRETLEISSRADFCVGYFNLRGWKQIDSYIESWAGGDSHCCRLLVGMAKLPQDELLDAFSLVRHDDELDNQTAVRLKNRLAEEFRAQLTIGMPTNDDEAGLRRLAAQIRAKKVVVKLFLRHPLHAKLYLLHLPHPINPIVGYLGSSNLTFAGLAKQGELNVDVLDHDACNKLARWFEDRWNDRWCMFYSGTGRHRIFYSRKVGYFLQILNFVSRVLDGKGGSRPPSEFKDLGFTTEEHAAHTLCCLNSNLFYWFVTVFSDCRHVNKREIDAFPINLQALAASTAKKPLLKLARTLMDDLQRNSENRTMRFHHDTLTVQCIYPKSSKSIIDEIDRVLAAHYGFTDEELDFIINYDIKYRMGRDAEIEKE